GRKPLQGDQHLRAGTAAVPESWRWDQREPAVACRRCRPDYGIRFQICVPRHRFAYGVLRDRLSPPQARRRLAGLGLQGISAGRAKRRRIMSDAMATKSGASPATIAGPVTRFHWVPIVLCCLVMFTEGYDAQFIGAVLPGPAGMAAEFGLKPGDMWP